MLGDERPDGCRSRQRPPRLDGFQVVWKVIYTGVASSYGGEAPGWSATFVVSMRADLGERCRPISESGTGRRM